MAKKNRVQSFTGITLEQWHADMENLRWAQTDPRFQMMLSVVLNEVQTYGGPEAGVGEGRAYGRVEGYFAALQVLRSMGRKQPKPPAPLEATHDESPDQAFKAADTLD